MERLFTTDEVAELLRVDVVTIRRLVNRGGLAAYRIGSEYRFAEADMQEYLRRQRVSGGEVYSSISFDGDPQGGRQMHSTNRFGKFTERARKVLSLAQEEAQRFQHNYIGTEHLLLGLVREGEGVAAKVLQDLGVDLQQVRVRVEAIIGRGDRIVQGSIGLTPRAKKVIELAVDEAQRLDHHYIGTEHLLLALIREGQGIAAGVLEELGVALDKARVATLQILSALQDKPSQAGAAAEAQAPVCPPLPAAAATLVQDGEQGIVCNRCGASSPGYFHYCFNCGQKLKEA